MSDSETAGTILIVDDAPENLRILSRMLTDRGHRVRAAHSGQEALDAARSDPPDLVLLDIKLPDLDGYEVCARLKADAATRDVPVLFLSALNQTREKLHGFEVGGVDYIVKPFHPEEVLARVHTHLELRRLRARLETHVAEILRAEEELRKSEVKLRTIFDNVKVGIMLLDTELRVLETNRQMETWFPAIGGERERQCFMSVNTSGDAGPCQGCPCLLSLADGHTHEASLEFGEPGHLRTYRLVAAPIRDAGGKVVAVIDLVEDITEKISLEHQVRVSQRLEAVGHLAGGVAHDFNNLLTVINGYAGFVMEGLRKDDPMCADLAEIRKAGERATTLTRQLLAFSRKQILRPTVVNLNDVVTNMEKMLRRVIGEDVDLETAVAPDLGTIHVDPGQLEQMIVNLVVNSRDAMPAGGTLTIETANVDLDEDYARLHPDTTPGPYAMLCVTDSGHGMDKATQEHIFEPFFTTKEPGKGTGLGLSTVYGSVKQSGGSIQVYSEAGKGTAFRLYFPRISQPPQALAGAAATAAATGSETLLVVEDEEAVRALAKRILGAAGYKVVTAANAGQALLLCERTREPIHLMLTDVIMPDMNGLELAQRLRDLRPEMKVLYTSGYTDNALAHRQILAEGMHFIAKPFRVAELAHKVREVLDLEASGGGE
ncbi:MAG: response regulator [Deltaproteobacteria bacterium]|nr:response regulator [Deltaproteobacteria bacterium]